MAANETISPTMDILEENRPINTESTVTEIIEDDNVVLDAELIMQYVYLAIGVFGMLGNLFVMTILLRFKHLRKSIPNMLIINQSVVDFAAAACIIFSTFFRDIDSIDTWLGKEVFCRVWLTNLPMWGMFVSSTYNLVSLTYERYLAIVHPLLHNRSVTSRKICVVIGLVWFIGPFYQASYMITTAAVKDGGSCSVYSEYPNQAAKQAMGIFNVVFQYFIPLLLIVYAYARIAYVLRGMSQLSPGAGERGAVPSASNIREQRMTKARRNTIKTLVLVSLCFVFCWSWNQILFLKYNLNFPTDFTGSFYHFTVITVFCNCCLNPIVYACKYEQFRSAVREIFRKPPTPSGAPGGQEDLGYHSNGRGRPVYISASVQSLSTLVCFSSAGVYTVENSQVNHSKELKVNTKDVQLTQYNNVKF